MRSDFHHRRVRPHSADPRTGSLPPATSAVPPLVFGSPAGLLASGNFNLQAFHDTDLARHLQHSLVESVPAVSITSDDKNKCWIIGTTYKGDPLKIPYSEDRFYRSGRHAHEIWIASAAPYFKSSPDIARHLEIFVFNPGPREGLHFIFSVNSKGCAITDFAVMGPAHNMPGGYAGLCEGFDGRSFVHHIKATLKGLSANPTEI